MDEEYEDDWDPTPQEKANMKRYRQLLERYPTFTILMKVLNRHRTIRIYENHGILDTPVGESARQNLEEGLDELCAAFPTDPDALHGAYSLQSVLEAVVHEFNPPEGDFDA